LPCSSPQRSPRECGGPQTTPKRRCERGQARLRLQAPRRFWAERFAEYVALSRPLHWMALALEQASSGPGTKAPARKEKQFVSWTTTSFSGQTHRTVGTQSLLCPSGGGNSFTAFLFSLAA